MVISDYYYSLPEQRRMALRYKFMTMAGMTRSTFYYKLKNNSFTKLEHDALLLIAAQEGGTDERQS